MDALWVIISFIGILVSFLFLWRVTKSFFIPSLDIIARKWRMSSNMAGATLMAAGSSAPELAIAIVAVLRPGEHLEIGLGTIIGSAVFNMLVIIGVVAVIKRTVLKWQPIARDLLSYFITIFLLTYIMLNGSIDIYESLLLLAFYILYIVFVFFYQKIFPYKTIPEKVIEEQPTIKRSSNFSMIFNPIDLFIHKTFPTKRYFWLIFFVSILIISGLSIVLVESTIIISEVFRIPEIFIAITIIAVGTSIPDLISSAIVARQGRGEMAISNAVGSNVFDILIGIGLPSLIFLLINSGTISVDNQWLLPSVSVLFGSIIIIFVFLLISRWKLGIKAGVSLLIIYLLYLIWVVRDVWMLSGS